MTRFRKLLSPYDKPSIIPTFAFSLCVFFDLFTVSSVYHYIIFTPTMLLQLDLCSVNLKS